jgi:hypothetical protein
MRCLDLLLEWRARRRSRWRRIRKRAGGEPDVDVFPVSVSARFRFRRLPARAARARGIVSFSLCSSVVKRKLCWSLELQLWAASRTQ